MTAGLPPLPASALARLQALVRLCASDVDGEALAAVRALDRAMRSHGRDWHWLAAMMAGPSPAAAAPKPAAAARKPPKPKPPPPEPRLRPWQTKASYAFDRRLNDDDRAFLSQMATRAEPPTSRQSKRLDALYRQAREKTKEREQRPPPQPDLWWHDRAKQTLDYDATFNLLRSIDRQFLQSMARMPRPPTEKQHKYLDSLHLRLQREFESRRTEHRFYEMP